VTTVDGVIYSRGRLLNYVNHRVGPPSPSRYSTTQIGYRILSEHMHAVMTRELNRSVYDSLRLAPSAMGEVWNMSMSMDGTFEFNRDMLQESKVPLANPIHLCRAGSAAHFMDACIWERLASKDFASFGDRMKSVAGALRRDFSHQNVTTKVIQAWYPKNANGHPAIEALL
jgi:hypothetical protein